MKRQTKRLDVPKDQQRGRCDYRAGRMGRTCSNAVASPGERRCITHGGMPGRVSVATAGERRWPQHPDADYLGDTPKASIPGKRARAATAATAPAEESAAVQAVRLAVEAGLPVRYEPKAAPTPLVRIRQALEKAARHGVFREDERDEVMTALHLMESRWESVDLNVRTMAGTAIETVRGWAKVLREAMEGRP